MKMRGERRFAGKTGRRLSASMTVEASFVMAMVIMSLSVLIKTAYRQCVRTTQVMSLHYAVEQLRCREDDQSKSLNYGQADRNREQIKGYVRIEGKEKEIIVHIHEPEEFLRMLTIFEPEGEKK